MTTTTTGPDVSLAPLIDTLQGVYRDLSDHVATVSGVILPPAIFIVKRDNRAWGHITTAPAWQADLEELDTDYPYGPWAMSMGVPMITTVSRGFHEIMVSGENLARGARAVFGTVAHETAHAVNIATGVRDVDSNGRHNTKFRDTAVGFFGLTIENAGHIGWSRTTVGDDCASTWASQIAQIDEAITAVSRHAIGGGSGGVGIGGMFGGGSPAPRGRDKNLTKAVCGCGDSIRASRKVLDKGVTCDECGKGFVAVK